jgi:ectoine hydroxylase
MPALLSIEQIQRFTTDGYLVFPDLVDLPTIERIRNDVQALLDTLVRRMSESATADPRITWWRLPSGQPYVLKIKPVADLVPSAAALAASPELVAAAAELLGAAPHLMEDKVMYKQIVNVAADWANLRTLGEEVCKHTDAAYFAARGHHRVLTVAVCLDASTEAAGALRVWPGTRHRNVTMVGTEHQGPVVLDNAAPDGDAVTLTAGPGSVLAWDAALVHASGPNTSGRPRRLLVLGYAPTHQPS